MRLLAPYRVLDLTDVRGQLAGMMLGDLGADVIRVEPTGGSDARREGPFLDDGPEAERRHRGVCHATRDRRENRVRPPRPGPAPR